MEAVTVERLSAILVEAYSAFCEAVRQLNQVSSRLEVLSLSQLPQGRWRTLTNYAVTQLGVAQTHLFTLIQVYGEVARMLWDAFGGDVPEHLVLVYQRGQASLNYLVSNMAYGAIYLPPSSVEGEVSILVSCALQLLSAVAGARREETLVKG
ncbi:MAG: hypothetical protein QXU60_07010 [Sulfolobales archaeon]